MKGVHRGRSKGEEFPKCPLTLFVSVIKMLMNAYDVAQNSPFLRIAGPGLSISEVCVGAQGSWLAAARHSSSNNTRAPAGAAAERRLAAAAAERLSSNNNVRGRNLIELTVEMRDFLVGVHFRQIIPLLSTSLKILWQRDASSAMDPTSGDAISKGLIASTIGDPGPYDNDAISKGATLAPVPSGAPSQHPTFQQQPPPGYAYAPQYQQGPPVGYAPQYASQYAPQYMQGPPVGYAQQYVGGAGRFLCSGGAAVHACDLCFLNRTAIYFRFCSVHGGSAWRDVCHGCVLTCVWRVAVLYPLPQLSERSDDDGACLRKQRPPVSTIGLL